MDGGYKRWSTTVLDWFEIVFSCWKDGTYLAPHDHGGSSGYVFLLWGELHERLFEEHDGKLIQKDRLVMRGPAFNRIDALDIHDVTASKKSVAAHLYYPMLGNTRKFRRPD
jgi:predicted metal-dependent enzyme (double-stranded beta helix superfamily)